MGIVRITASCLAAVAALGVISLTASDGAFAARAHRVVMNQPVCGLRADGPQNYANAAAARHDHAKVVYPGDCQTITCWSWAGVVRSEPMCGINAEHVRMTFPNRCAAMHAEATWVHDGPCGGRT
ncbi:MAG TPA: hypothetical protein VL048_20015 [Xanthobacteraceae bacterium]|nr:hypothetical protein [Xanthobacteraceae bacterium]